MPENISLPNRVKSIVTTDAVNITSACATLGGRVLTNDADTVTCGVIYGVSSSLSSASGTKLATSSFGDFSVTVTGLEAQTTYYYRAYAIDAGRYKYGEVRSFDTKPSISVITGSQVSVTATTATLGGEVVNAEAPLPCGIIYGTSSTLSATSGTVLSTTSAGAYSLSVTELDENTTYYYRAYVIDGDEYKYGEVLSFKTKLKISITTSQPVDVTATTATLGGKVVNAEEALPCGIIYGTSSSLSSTSGTVLTTTSDGAYSLSVTELDENTTYYYRAYVVDGDEYKYGEVLSFKTKLKISITTSQPVDVTATTATLGGVVVNAEAPLPCGIIYGTSSSLSSTSGTVLSTTSDGVYSLSVTELDENTTYYYRAYVVDGGEYKYGEVLSFKTKLGVTVTTKEAADVTANTASLGGKVNNAEEPLTCGIIYGTSSTLSATSGTVVSATSVGDYSVIVSGLKESTTYYYRAYVVDGGEYKYGEVLSFKTKRGITVTTNDAADITVTTASLGGKIHGAEQDFPCGIIYGTSTTLSSTNGIVRSTTSSDDFSVSVTGLDGNTTYYYRAYVIVADEYRYGDIRSFKTKYITVTTGSATEITASKVTLSGALSNAEQSLACGIIYGTSTTLSATSGTMKPTTSSGDFSVSITGLDDNTTYYYRAYVVDAGEYKYGDVNSFRTKGITVTTGDATNITASKATLAGSVDNVEGSQACGIIYGISSSLSATNGTMKSTTSSGDFSVSITGLDENKTYYYRAYVVVADEYRYGEVNSFKTQCITVTTGSATDITVSGATLAGSVDNADELLACGIVYGTSSSLSATNGTMKSTTSSGDFSVSITGLDEYTTYYYRAYVVVADEYRYGEVLSFTTKKQVTVTTGDATNITASGATLAGTINNAEKSLICGIIYGKSSTLSATDGTKKYTASSGDFSVSITGLNLKTTYYYRAYAIVDGEYKYGDIRSFTTILNDFVDLGLSVKWASCNVGANSPEEYGDYFAWGETTAKSSYTEDNSITYGLSTSELKSRGIIDSDGNLTAAYDAATVNWGDACRMPTLDEFNELIKNCTWEWTSVNGVNGQLVTGPNGNSIFLPAAGDHFREDVSYRGMYGDYWSSTLYANDRYSAFYLFFYDGDWGKGHGYRGNGHTVRPVTHK